MGYFYWLRVKNSNHLHTGLSLDYLKDTKFYHESKASFIRISGIASFKPFLTVWLREYCTFSDSSVKLEVLPLAKIYPVWNYFAKKKNVLLSNFFPSSNMFFIRLFLANTKTKKRGSPSSFNRKGALISLSSLL